MRDIKNGIIEWDYQAVGYFMNRIESNDYTMPKFGASWYKRPNATMETESDLPF